ncbi:NAD dependent epimerase/dehydratase family protein [Caballeronia sordidicola]|uniref:NAD dependent epimerase/dehydratase family protein n=1 Tax=Caballeronia sordidicola TaxID=196367 RepID=A0A158I4H8_CABSO|nr:NAD(P)-dependent oxidoreductase [Caballeronia sordidicola]SAL51159.1 NAD dependent epimerase/dehydratase family protein [Caballeronia sordidicola]
MRIAILGATSQLGKDLTLSFMTGADELVLFARRPGAVTQWLESIGAPGRYQVADFDRFDQHDRFNAVINFVGVGDPAQAAAMGASIFDITLKFDELALTYVRAHPECRYIFFSSGAAYCSRFDQPVDASTRSLVAINQLRPEDWYSIAKLHAECRHRSLPELPIVDIRVFNYFSRTQDMTARFFITDTVRAIQSGKTLATSAENITRDYLGPDDFYQLVQRILNAQPANDVVDCYTKAPVEKLTLLSELQQRFGLKYRVTTDPAVINATGAKMHYYSTNRKAEAFGYTPTKNSLDNVLDELALVFSTGNGR